MSLIIVGTNHKFSPIELRERLSFSKKHLRDALFLLKERGILNGAVIISTCNRVEIYASVKDSERGIREIEEFLSCYHEIKNEAFSSYLYIYKDKEAIKHLFSVACGLDSLILGETQILGQLKKAFFEALNLGFVDESLRKIFYSALYSAKKIHSQTKLSEGKVSAGSLAIDYIKDSLGTISDKNILVVGVGKVTELVIRYLKEDAPNVIFVSNRTFDKAKELASQIGAKAVRFDELRQCLNKADIVITATASPHFIIKKETLEGITHKLLIVDLALPRDVDPCVKEIKNVHLLTLEDLDTAIKKNIDKRANEAEKVKDIINIEVERLWASFTELAQESAPLL